MWVCGSAIQHCVYKLLIPLFHSHPPFHMPSSRWGCLLAAGSLCPRGCETPRCDPCSASPAVLPPHSQLPGAPRDFLSGGHSRSVSVIVVGLGFLKSLYCNRKGSQEGDGTAHVLSRAPFPRNPVVIVTLLITVGYCR